MNSYLVSELLHYCNIKVKGCVKMPPDETTYYDFTFVLDGSMVYTFNGEQYEMKKNDAIFLPPRTVRSREAGNSPVSYVSFNFRAFPHIHFPFPLFMQGCITSSMRGLVSVFPERHLLKQYHSCEKCISMLNYLLFELMDTVALGSSNPHVLKILRYIGERQRESISLDDISRHVNLSKEYCSYLFKKETNKSLIYYINERKMMIAKDLLVNHEMSLADIAEHMGFDNYNYFSRLFKKYFGISPTDMKRQDSRDVTGRLPRAPRDDRKKF